MAVRRKTTKMTRQRLYAASQYLNSKAEQELGLQIPFTVYLQDPLVAQLDPKFGFDKDLMVGWEPGFSDGPTSARFAIVDYNADTGHLAPMAKWDPNKEAYLDQDGKVLDEKNTKPLQFHQVNVWAVLQRAMTFFEQGQGLGRPIPFGFEGNRLIVVPHAGYGKNAFYDRKSKSLQFYYFDNDDGKRVYTCLSTDIINHEFGHAVLDGVRPYFIESSLDETGAFHEFMGDLTAILLILRNNKFRSKLVESTGGDLSKADQLSRIAEEFGKAASDNDYLRTADNDLKMSDRIGSGPHALSEVMTGAMYEILRKLSEHYLSNPKNSAKDAFWYAIQRMQRVAIQPLDLLPPIDVTFEDYALAVLRAEELANPTDPHGYIETMLKVFVEREILNESQAAAMREPRYVYARLRLDIFHDIDKISRSRAGAYRFLNDNRNMLLVPASQDFFVADLYDSQKLTREARRMPRQIILEYLWRENVPLEGPEFGEFEGQSTTMLCGGTIVFDETGTVLSWTRKPGTQGGRNKAWKEEIAAGKKRRDKLLEDIAHRIKSGQVGAILGSAKGLLGAYVPPVTVREQDGILRFERSPHMSLSGEDHDHYQGGRPWEVSS